jgi:DNA-binding response OmpR family regulator
LERTLNESKKKILVVDDEKMIRWSLGEALRGWGYQSIEAETVAAALALFEAEAPAAVLLDINLPDGSGLDAATDSPAPVRRSGDYDHRQCTGR